MAFVPTALDFKITSGAANITSNSVTFTSGRLYFVVGGGGGSTQRLVTSLTNNAGVSGTWTEGNSGTDQTWSDGLNFSYQCFYGTNISGTGTVTLGLAAATSAQVFFAIYEIADGFDTSGLIVQTVYGVQLPTAGTGTAALADSAAAANMRLALLHHRVNEALTANNGGTVVNAGTNTSPDVNLSAWYKTGDATSDPSVSWSTTSRSTAWLAFEIKASASGATGTASWTEAADTATGSGTETFTGTSSWTEAADTATGVAAETFTGTSAWTEAADTCTGAGVVPSNFGTASWTEAADTATGAAAETFTGTSSWTEAADTATGSGTVTASGFVLTAPPQIAHASRRARAAAARMTRATATTRSKAHAS